MHSPFFPFFSPLKYTGPDRKEPGYATLKPTMLKFPPQLCHRWPNCPYGPMCQFLHDLRHVRIIIPSSAVGRNRQKQHVTVFSGDVLAVGGTHPSECFRLCKKLPQMVLLDPPPLFSPPRPPPPPPPPPSNRLMVASAFQPAAVPAVVLSLAPLPSLQPIQPLPPPMENVEIYPVESYPVSNSTSPSSSSCSSSCSGSSSGSAKLTRPISPLLPLDDMENQDDSNELQDLFPPPHVLLASPIAGEYPYREPFNPHYKSVLQPLQPLPPLVSPNAHPHH